MVGGVLVPLLCVLLASCIHGEEQEVVHELVGVGDSLPHISVTLLDGSRVDNTTWEGKTLVLTFFSTTCQDCRKEMPEVERFYRMTQNRDDVYTLGISRGGGYQAVKDYWDTMQLSFPCSPQDNRTIYNLFANSIVPRIYIVAPSGIVTASFDDTNMPTAEEMAEVALR